MTQTMEVQTQRIPASFARHSEAAIFTVNERRILNLVRREGALSRADLARRMDLTMQSVVRLVDGLLERGFVRAGEKVVRGVGQPSVPIMLVEKAAMTVGVSVMHDSLSVLLMTLSGEVLASRLLDLDTAAMQAVVGRLAIVIEELVVEADAARSCLFGVGVSITGYFIDANRLNTPKAMDDWALRDLEADLSERLQLPVWLENDGNAGAVGENLYGVGSRFRSFAYIFVSTGLGGGLIQDGAPLRGAHGNAGEFTGLLPVDSRVSRPTLLFLLDLLRADGVPVETVGEMLARFDPQWPAIKTWLDLSEDALTAIVSSIAAVIDPEAIVIGGRLPTQLARLLAERAAFYRAPVRDRERPFPSVIAAEAPGDAAALGAAAIPLQKHFFS